jgi:hypothetical protein
METINDELEIICKELAAACFKILHRSMSLEGNKMRTVSLWIGFRTADLERQSRSANHCTAMVIIEPVSYLITIIDYLQNHKFIFKLRNMDTIV